MRRYISLHRNPRVSQRRTSFLVHLHKARADVGPCCERRVYWDRVCARKEREGRGSDCEGGEGEGDELGVARGEGREGVVVLEVVGEGVGVGGVHVGCYARFGGGFWGGLGGWHRGYTEAKVGLEGRRGGIASVERSPLGGTGR